MTRYVIGDIHGGSKTFRALLDRLSLKHSDRLYLLGDYVDRGNCSRGVLDIILQLMDSGHDVRPIRGNHDDMMLRCFTGQHDDCSPYWEKQWGWYTLFSFGVSSVDKIPVRYLALLDALPTILMEDDFVFVHAALNMAEDDPISQTSEMEMLWGEVALVNSKKIGGRKLITGHTIRPIQLIEISMMSSRIYLDNGAFTNQQPDLGNLVAFNLDSMELTLQPWLDGETLE
ncbi:MAG: metallophosphoesterase family protein [Desulfuromonadaceae bacterium]|nr:metallophosphoesterase family protein [Desulfuromonadaceae bacterium]